MLLFNRNGVGIHWSSRSVYGNITTSLLDAVESTAICNQILDHRKRFGPPRFNYDFVPIIKTTHVQLTGRNQ